MTKGCKIKHTLAVIAVALIPGRMLANKSLADSDVGVSESRGVFTMLDVQPYAHTSEKKNIQVY